MSRKAVFVLLMAAMAPCLALPFDDIEQTPMNVDGTKTVSKKGGIPIKGGSQLDPPPLGTCETYTVSRGKSSEPHLVDGYLVVAISPSSSFAMVEVHMEDAMYLVHVQGSMVNLTKCSADGDDCEVADVNSAKRPDILTPGQWNFINITIKDDKIDVSINSMEKLTGMHKKESAVNVTVVVDGTDIKVPDDYTAFVQYSCESTQGPSTVIPVTRSPGEEGQEGTPIPQTGKEGDEEEEGPDVGLIVGIVVAVIVVAVIAGIIYSKKVRKSADINSQTPLQQQQQ